jgi:hypothetical protein
MKNNEFLTIPTSRYKPSLCMTRLANIGIFFGNLSLCTILKHAILASQDNIHCVNYKTFNTFIQL